MTIQAITTTHVSNSNNRTGRIEATCEGKSLALRYDRKVSAKKNHQSAAALLKKRMGWSGELHGCRPLSGEHVWVVMPEWIRGFGSHCEALGGSAFEALSILESHYEAHGRQLSA